MQTTRLGQLRTHTANTPQINRTEIRTGEIPVALPGIRFDLLLSEIAQLYAIGAIDIPCDNGNLLFDGEVQIVKKLELGFALAGSDQSFRQISRTSATLGPVIANNGGIRTTSQCLLPDELKFCGCIGPMLSSATTRPSNMKNVVRKAVDSDHHLQAKFLGVLNVSDQILRAFFKCD